MRWGTEQHVGNTSTSGALTNTPSGSSTSALPQVGLSMQPYMQQAPLTNQQLAGMQLTSDISQPVQNYLGNAMNASGWMGSGALMNPATNPYLQQYAQNALQQQLQNYQQVTAPNLLQQAAQTGTLGSQGMAQGFNNAQTALSQGIGNTLAGIYEPAYQAGMQGTLQAQGQAPQLAQAQYTPANALLDVGNIGQKQTQGILNTAYGNLNQQANWPFSALGTLGTGLSTLGGSSGTTIAQTPNASPGK